MEVRELLSSYEYPGDDIPIVMGSAHQAMIGERKDIGEDSIRALMKAVDEYIPTPTRMVDLPFLLPIEDVFSISGRGTVVTGRIERGVINVGDEVEIAFELQAIKVDPDSLDRSAMIPLAILSEKSASSGSPEMLSTASTATVGPSLGRKAAGAAFTAAAPSMECQRQIVTGRAMFLTSTPPLSAKAAPPRSRMIFCTTDDTQMPPGAARGFSRAAMFTPSP